MTTRPDNSVERSSSWRRLGEGTLTEVWTDGVHVRRPLGSWSAAVHQLLERLEQHEVPGVPRFVAVEDAAEILTLVSGRAIRRPWPDAVRSPRWMEQVGRWLRLVHGATSGFQLADGASFAWGPAEPGPGHVVTHGDLGPWNMLERDGEFAGVIDWDLARFGDPLDDLAEVAFELGPLRQDRDMLAEGAAAQTVQTRIAALCRGYGGATTDQVLRRVDPLYQHRIDEMARRAADAEAPFVALARAGNLEALQEDLEHFRRHF